MFQFLKFRVRPGPALALGLLVLGLIVEVGFTSPQMRELSRCAAERDRLRQQIMGAGRQEERRLALAGALGSPNLEDALRAQTGADPIDYLGRLLAQTGLKRTELGTQRSTETERIRRTTFFLRASGRFGQIVDFLRELEQGPRLVSVDDFQIQQAAEDPKTLEARIELSTYEPLVRP